MQWDRDDEERWAWPGYPPWLVFALGMVAGLLLSWAQYAWWARDLIGGR